jgi:hypothetical protein
LPHNFRERYFDSPNAQYFISQNPPNEAVREAANFLWDHGPFAHTTSPKATQTGLAVPYKTSRIRFATNSAQFAVEVTEIDLKHVPLSGFGKSLLKKSNF